MERGSVSGEPKDLPVELMGRMPRRVRLTGTGWLNVFAATLFSLLGAAFAVHIAKEFVHDTAIKNALRQSGVESRGQIIDAWAGGKYSAPGISYSFSVDGTSYTGRSDVPHNLLGSLHQNDSLTVRYLPADPNTSHPAAWEESTASLLRGLFFPIFLVFFGLMFVRRFPLQRRLAMQGLAVRGCVTEREGNGPSRGQPYVNYTFRIASNDEVEIGSCPCDSYPKAGSSVCVLYLPQDPKRNEIYPFGIEFFRIDQ